MKTRETSYEDYGFDINEAKRLKEYCRSPNFSDHKTLMDSAISANPCIASDLYYSIASGVSYDDLIACGSHNAAKEKGLIRLEGKDYVVKDGDIMLFRFNV